LVFNFLFTQFNRGEAFQARVENWDCFDWIEEGDFAYFAGYGPGPDSSQTGVR
jgi:hypothetical protein